MPLCTLCPRNCRVDRSKTTGVCSVKGLRLAKASLHFGEEPCISGTDGKGAGTIFFSGCSLKCIFCQNMPISRDGYGKEISPERLGEIMLDPQEKGAHNIDLVTPTHYADVIAGVLEKIRPQLEIPVVYNCGGYEKVDTFFRLWLTPGDGHGDCKNKGPGIPESAGMKALIDWVENGIAPDELRTIRVDKRTGELLDENTRKHVRLHDEY